ncbi:MAG: PIG-L deacetylase family protein [Dehalococcoidia bacterium]
MGDETGLKKLPEGWKKALAVVAHPDDLEFGTSSAVARWTSQGKEVVYLIVSRGEAGIDSMAPEEAGRIREDEQRRSAKVVGVDTVEFLDYRDGVIEYGLPLRRDITRAIRKHRPDVVLSGNHHLTWSSGTFNMADHRWVGLAVLDAVRDAGNRWIFPELLKEGLEPWDQVRMVFVGHSPDATHAVDVTDFIDKGIASLNEHKVYIENLSGGFDPDTFLRWGAAEVGEQAGCELAVAFEVINL